MNTVYDKTLLLYGKKRYCHDFMYVFKDLLNISGLYCDDEYDLKEIIHIKNSDEVIIICQYDPLETVKYADTLGLKKNKDYIYADSLFYLLDFPIKEISKERDIYIWGIGARGHKFCHEFVEKYPDVEIAGYVDSAPENYHKTWFRKTIYSPEEVLKTNGFYVITTDDYFDEISEILKKNGKVPEKDYVHRTAINTRASWMMRETVYDRPRLDYICKKPFEDSVLGLKGGLSVCAGIMNMPSWGVPGFYSSFSSIWHSNIMKVLRLSIINGTYSFCDKVKCNYLFECGQREIDLDELHYYTSREKESLDAISKKEYYPKNHIFNIENYCIVERKYPDVVFLSFDFSCNLHCPSCRDRVMVETGMRKKRLVGFDNRMKEELYPHVNRLKVSGTGEVFASEVHQATIFDKKIADKVKKIGILSNGSLFNKEKFDRLYDLYEEIVVFISMDGATKETAEKLRRGVDFDKWKSNMEYLGQMRAQQKIKQLSFNFVVQRENYKEMAEYARMCLKYEADAIKFSKIYKSRTISDEDFLSVSMFDLKGEMLPELKEVINDEVFKSPKIHLFTWLDW